MSQYYPTLTQAFVARLSLNEECLLAINISGGKDSQAMLAYLNYKFPEAHKEAIFADLGRAEWQQTRAFVEHLCQKEKVPLVRVRAEKDLIDYFIQRHDNLALKGEEKTKPFWSDSKNRYCTSQSKVAPINKYLRRYSLVVNCIGIRAKESSARSTKNPFKVRKDISSKIYHDLDPKEAYSLWQNNPDRRLVLDYYPLFDWDLDAVWDWCGHTTADWLRRRAIADDRESLNGWKAHPAYVLGRGNERLSCCFCVLGSINDLQNAVPYNRETYRILTGLERDYGWDFKKNRSLKSIGES